MDTDTTIRRAQVYSFLSDAFLYPDENWGEDVPLLNAILAGLDFPTAELIVTPLTLVELQAAYRRTFGAVGSLCYETEYGLPHEFRQSQELADINGFYRAFGFSAGGRVRERPDHLAAELEFMCALALKQVYAARDGLVEHVEVCLEAQRRFLQDHLGRWIDLFAQSLALNAGEEPYLALARLAAAFVNADAARLGLQLEQRALADAQHTPFDPDFSCAGCSLPEMDVRISQRSETGVSR